MLAPGRQQVGTPGSTQGGSHGETQLYRAGGVVGQPWFGGFGAAAETRNSQCRRSRACCPAAYFFRGQSATVELRNSAGFGSADGKLVLAGLVDTSGYAAEVQAKYQGFLITEVKLNIEGSHLAPGQYGFGFSKDGKFYLMDVGANDVFRVAAQTDDQLARPVPLKMIEGQAGYRLYAGRRWVNLKPE